MKKLLEALLLAALLLACGRHVYVWGWNAARDTAPRWLVDRDGHRYEVYDPDLYELRDRRQITTPPMPWHQPQ